jgi:hypothetical protein
MMIVIPKGYEQATLDAVPKAEDAVRMMEYNKSLQKAGALLALDGLFPPSAGVRISTMDGKATVTDGPFAEAAAEMDEALTWARKVVIACRVPVEVREIPYSSLPSGTPHPSRLHRQVP